MIKEMTIELKENAEILRDYAFLSSQHCYFVLNLCEICRIRLGREATDQLSAVSQGYYDIKENCEAIYKKRYAYGNAGAQTDAVLMRSIIANFNQQSIEFINRLNDLLKNPELVKIHHFLKHMLLEQKQFLENTYRMAG